MAAFAAWFFYPANNQWTKSVRWTLFGLRTFLLFLVLALLLNPLIKKFRQTVLPPVALILIDDSQSVVLGSNPDSLSLFRSEIKLAKEGLQKSGYQVFVSGLEKDINVDSLFSFNIKESAIYRKLKGLEEEFDNQNLSRVILASDGITNVGADLSGVAFPFSISTIKLGNPYSRKDLIVSQVRVNKVGFLGNSFPVSVQVKGKKLEGSPIFVSISDNGKVLESKTANIGNNSLANLEFQIKASSKGIKQYSVEVKAIAGELTIANNKRQAFIEIVDGRQKVLLLASTPHPDIQAIKSALEPLNQFELTTIVGGLDAYKAADYNLIILHQLPDRTGTFASQVSQFLKGNTATFLICGSGTDINKLRLESSSWLSLQGFGGPMDEITTGFNSDFQRFQFDENWKNTLNDLPPIKSPGLGYGFKSGAEVILQKKLGKAIIPTPLLAVSMNTNPKRGVFWGEGLWLWRMNEFAQNENFAATDNLLQKTIQLLVSADKKQGLKVYLAQNEISEGESANFFAETYNQLYEQVYNQKVQIVLQKNGGKKLTYSFFNSQTNSSLITEGLVAGTYSYVATSQINGKTETDKGEFIVKANELESQELEANHGMLEDIAKANNGTSVGIGSIKSLIPNGDEKPKPLISFTDWEENILSLWWILVVLIGLASTEWFVRKLNGSL